MELMINVDDFGRRVRVYGYTRQGPKEVIVGYNGHSLVETAVMEAEPIPDDTPMMLDMPRVYFEDFVREIVRYAHNRNIHAEDENHLKGKLEATLEHVSSLRSNSDRLLGIVETLVAKIQ